jgi:predicted Zn-dependent protease with MMP-like domain
MAYRVSKLRFGELVERALDELPPEFAEFLSEVPVEARDRPSAAQMSSVGLAPRHLLLGLYQGRPRTQRSVEDSGRMPDVIYIFQESIEQVCNSEQELIAQV